MENEKETLEYELIDICIDSSNYEEGEETASCGACDVVERGKPAAEIVYDAEGIPMGSSMVEIRKREKIVADFLSRWREANADGKEDHRDRFWGLFWHTL